VGVMDDYWGLLTYVFVAGAWVQRQFAGCENDFRAMLWGVSR